MGVISPHDNSAKEVSFGVFVSELTPGSHIKERESSSSSSNCHWKSCHAGAKKDSPPLNIRGHIFAIYFIIRGCVFALLVGVIYAGSLPNLNGTIDFCVDLFSKYKFSQGPYSNFSIFDFGVRLFRTIHRIITG